MLDDQKPLHFCILVRIALSYASILCKVKGSCPVLKTWPKQKQNLVEALKLNSKVRDLNSSGFQLVHSRKADKRIPLSQDKILAAIKLDLLSRVSAGTEVRCAVARVRVTKKLSASPDQMRGWSWSPNSLGMESREKIENASSQIPWR